MKPCWRRERPRRATASSPQLGHHRLFGSLNKEALGRRHLAGDVGPACGDRRADREGAISARSPKDLFGDRLERGRRSARRGRKRGMKQVTDSARSRRSSIDVAAQSDKVAQAKAKPALMGGSSRQCDEGLGGQGQPAIGQRSAQEPPRLVSIGHIAPPARCSSRTKTGRAERSGTARRWMRRR